MTHQQHLQTMYIAYYGRPADPAGLVFWTQQVEVHGMAWVYEAFTQSQEFNLRYASKSQPELINDWFVQALNRPATQQEVNAFRQQLSEGVSYGQLLSQLVDKAQADPAGQQVLTHRVEFAQQFTRQVEQTDTSFTLVDVTLVNRLMLDISTLAETARNALETLAQLQAGQTLSEALTPRKEDKPAEEAQVYRALNEGVYTLNPDFDRVDFLMSINHEVHLRGSSSAVTGEEVTSTLDSSLLEHLQIPFGTTLALSVTHWNLNQFQAIQDLRVAGEGYIKLHYDLETLQLPLDASRTLESWFKDLGQHLHHNDRTLEGGFKAYLDSLHPSATFSLVTQTPAVQAQDQELAEPWSATFALENLHHDEFAGYTLGLTLNTTEDETLILDFTVEHYTGLQSIVDAFNALEEGAFAHFDATTQSDNLNLAAVETQAGVEYSLDDDSLVIIGIPETPAS